MKYTDYEGNKFNLEARIYYYTSGQYAHIKIDFFYCDDKREKHFSGHDLKDFRITCQTDSEKINKDYPIYAHEFEVNSVNLDNIDNASKIMKVVNNGIKKYYSEFGYINGNFGLFVVVVLKSLGIKTVEINNYQRPLSDVNAIIDSYIWNKKQNWMYEL
jgi:hypothetical protein